MAAMPDDLLRPDFTHALAARLEQGASINLTARHGCGRRRTLQDLRTVLAAKMRDLYADMKFCADDCAGMLADLGLQAHLHTPHIAHLGQLIEALVQKPEPALLILHNFDQLRPGMRNQTHDPQFDSCLLPYLHTFAEHRHLALLTVCEDVYEDWPLPCEHLPIPSQNPSASD
ncbi:MAG: hypothetical protein R8L58_02295 [Mariprofundaceae bacterium]